MITKKILISYDEDFKKGDDLLSHLVPKDETCLVPKDETCLVPKDETCLVPKDETVALTQAHKRARELPCLVS